MSSDPEYEVIPDIELSQIRTQEAVSTIVQLQQDTVYSYSYQLIQGTDV